MLYHMGTTSGSKHAGNVGYHSTRVEVDEIFDPVHIEAAVNEPLFIRYN